MVTNQFSINSKNKVTDTKVLRGVNLLLDKEASKVPQTPKYIIMKKTILFLAFLFIVLSTGAQTKDSIASLIQQFDYYGALQQINKLPLDSIDNQLRHHKADALKALSRFDEAIVCLENIYETDSTDLKLTLELADCYKSALNYSKPQELYEKALHLHPGNKYLMQLLAGNYMTTEQYKKAKSLYLNACDNDTTVFLLKQIAGCYEKLGQDDYAIFYYQRAAHWNPNDYQPAFRLASIYKNQHKFEKSIAITDSFLMRFPDNRDVNRLSAYLHYAIGDFSTAIEGFEQCLKLSDTSAFVLKYLGYSYFKLNDFQKTIRCLEKIFAVDSTDAEMCYVLGLSHDVPQNIRYFNSAINQTSPVVNMLSIIFQDLALALTKDWKYNDALAALMKASELAPRDPAILYKIGVHYDNWMDDKRIALKYYREFLSTRGGNMDTPFVITGTSVVTQSDYLHAEQRIQDIELSLAQPVMVSDTTININHP
jgi:tetratricopeptide (TPR) repeat protein